MKSTANTTVTWFAALIAAIAIVATADSVAADDPFAAPAVGADDPFAEPAEEKPRLRMNRSGKTPGQQSQLFQEYQARLKKRKEKALALRRHYRSPRPQMRYLPSYNPSPRSPFIHSIGSGATSSYSSTSGKVWVRPYTRKDGTHVRGHYRSR